jgi:hypothetical protein
MLFQNTEIDRRWSMALRAAFWRSCASKVREASSHTRDERNSVALVKIARDYDFLAEWDAATRRLWL